MFNHKTKPENFSFRSFANENFAENTIISEDIMFDLNTQNTLRNNNIFVLGDPEFTNELVEPNILQANSSYFIIDKNGFLHNKYSHFLEDKGYAVKYINFANPEESSHYNPFNYIYEKEDIPIVSDCLFQNTTSFVNDSFIEKDLFELLCLYMLRSFSKSERTFRSLISLLKENNAEKTISQMFEEYKVQNPSADINFFWRLINDKLEKSNIELPFVISALYKKLSLFENENIESITSFDELELGSLSEKKTAIFCIAPDETCEWERYRVLYSLLCRQAIQAEINRRDQCYRCGIPLGNETRTRFFLSGVERFFIPEFDLYIAICCAYKLSFCITVNELSQFKNTYLQNRVSYETIFGNCNTAVFLTNSDNDSVEYAKRFFAQSKGFQNAIKLQLTPSTQISDEKYIENLKTTPNPKETDCIVSIRGVNVPFLCRKFKIQNHPNY